MVSSPANDKAIMAEYTNPSYMSSKFLFLEINVYSINSLQYSSTADNKNNSIHVCMEKLLYVFNVSMEVIRIFWIFNEKKVVMNPERKQNNINKNGSLDFLSEYSIKANIISVGTIDNPNINIVSSIFILSPLFFCCYGVNIVIFGHPFVKPTFSI